MNTIRNVILIYVLFLPLMVKAQNISVSSFKLLENDLTANTTGTMVRDQNGEVAALIKVVTTEQGFVFDGGMTGIVKTKQGVGEIWVYVPHGIKRITVQHPQLGVLRDYYFPIAIEKGKTYELVLTTGKVETIVTRTAGKQYVMFTVSPTNAVVELDGMPLEVVDGYAEKSMAYGTYDYRVSCANYYTEAGKVTVSSQGKVEKKVTLRPNFGWMSFDGDEGSLGADVYVNGERMGQLPFTTKQLKSGRYQIRVAKSMYETYEAEVTVTDNESQQLYVQLKPNFGWIKLDAANEFHGAHVYINDERVGQLPLTTDRMTSGTYQIKVLKSLFKPYVNQVIVEDNATTSLNVKLVPNYANVTLVTDPEAEIWIDEKLKGKGKCTVELELGNYMVEVKRTSHRTISDVVTITDVAPRTIQLLSPTPIYGTLDVTSTPSRAIVYIDEVEVGQTPLILNEVLVGERKVTVKKDGHESQNRVVTIKENTDNALSVNLSANIVEQSKPTSNRTYTANGVSFEMIAVKGGVFSMGGTSEQGNDAYNDEKPVHQVKLQDFSIGETEVTQELWIAVMGNNPSNFREDLQRPVENVSWKDCQEFISKLNDLTKENFRLPTEAEWEYAARGGSKSKRYKYSGSNVAGDVAWFSTNSTHPVKLKQANELGIYDMSGNVWEWCADCFEKYPSTFQRNPKGGVYGSNHVLRGGSWRYFERYCRVSCRDYEALGSKYNNCGFRLAL